MLLRCESFSIFIDIKNLKKLFKFFLCLLEYFMLLKESYGSSKNFKRVCVLRKMSLFIRGE